MQQYCSPMAGLALFLGKGAELGIVSLRSDSSRPQTSEERARGKATLCCGEFSGTLSDCFLASSVLTAAVMSAEARDVYL